MSCRQFINALIRRKQVDDQKVDESVLKRCLSFFDLTCLGEFNQLIFEMFNLNIQLNIEYSIEKFTHSYYLCFP